MASGFIERDYGTVAANWGSQYWKFPGGLMIALCTETCGGVGGTSFVKDVTYPVPFIETPWVWISTNNDSSGHYDNISSSTSANTPTGCTVRLSRTASGYVGGSFRVLAIGRWK